ncbi:MAG TPA: carbohydrate binding family 9 domain-containing protein, partial [Gemmatimonadaceae bacterium]|nr:carbohydrate binding family 9 domain-containing protein [Gemmatimonadaceae bacterium]
MTLTTRRRSAFVLALTFAAVPRVSRAQGSDATAHPAPPVAVAVRRGGPVKIDGLLTDSAWRRATPIAQFRQIQPNEGESASLPMEVRILYDEDALYVGARMREPAGLAAPLARRDQLLDANGNNGSFNSLTTDKLVVDFDPYHNHLDDALFEVNPAGVKGDQFNGDPSWDPIWEAAAHVDADGWTAEMRIPFSQLRFSRDTAQTWGMQIWRYIDRLNERDMWAFWRRNEPGGPAFFGDLTGLEIGARPRQLELLPYVVTGSTFKQVPSSDPYH